MRFASLLSLAILLQSIPPNQGQSSVSLQRARVLIEANCITCPQKSQDQLEEGIRLAEQVMNSSETDRRGILRLLVDGYSTLGVAFFKPGSPEWSEAIGHADRFLKELATASPRDANVQYELVHRVVGGVEFGIANGDQRITQIRRVLVLDPRHEEARFDLAKDLFRKGQDNEALRLLQELVRTGKAEKTKAYVETRNNFLNIRSRSKQVVSRVLISGEVSTGQTFERTFGQNLVFRLRPVGEGAMAAGWDIEVSPRNSSTAMEYSSVLTGPLHGFNPRYLWEGYGFNARQLVEMTPRYFRFVRSQQDYERARKNDEVIRGWTPVPDGQTPEQAFHAALNDTELIPYCTGFFRILDFTITPGSEPATEVISRLKFEVELCGPQRW